MGRPGTGEIPRIKASIRHLKSVGSILSLATILIVLLGTSFADRFMVEADALVIGALLAAGAVGVVAVMVALKRKIDNEHDLQRLTKELGEVHDH